MTHTPEDLLICARLAKPHLEWRVATGLPFCGGTFFDLDSTADWQALWTALALNGYIIEYDGKTNKWGWTKCESLFSYESDCENYNSHTDAMIAAALALEESK